MNIKKIKISENKAAFKAAEAQYKLSLQSIVRVQAEAKDLGLDVTSKQVKESKDIYTEIADLLYKEATTGFNMPSMDSAGFLKLQGVDLTKLQAACDRLLVTDKPKASEFVRYATTKKESDRVELLTKFSDSLNEMVEAGILLRPEMVRQYTNSALIIEDGKVTFNPFKI
tara:strand:- start:658 stop:1167 length:510 start_codon:yes stop_codon:yes gene_type:complete